MSGRSLARWPVTLKKSDSQRHFLQPTEAWREGGPPRRTGAAARQGTRRRYGSDGNGGQGIADVQAPAVDVAPRRSRVGAASVLTFRPAPPGAGGGVGMKTAYRPALIR
eukprot:gene11750-biopygen6010